MVRRGRFRDRTRRLAGTGRVSVSAEGKTAFLLAERPCRVAIGDAAPVDLGRRDALRLDDPAGRGLILTADGAVEATLVELFAAARTF